MSEKSNLGIVSIAGAESWYSIRHDLIQPSELFDNYLESLDSLGTDYGFVMKKLLLRVLKSINDYDDEFWDVNQGSTVRDRPLEIEHGGKVYGMNIRLVGKIKDDGSTSSEDVAVGAANRLVEPNRIFEFRVLVYPRHKLQKEWMEVTQDDVVLRGIFQVGSSMIFLETGVTTYKKFVFGVFDKADNSVSKSRTTQMARLLDGDKAIQHLLSSIG